MDFQNEARSECDLKLKNNDNLGNFKSLAVYDQVRKEALALQDRHTDPIIDIKVRMIEERNSSSLNITIHQLCIIPFTVYMFAKSQINALVKYKKKKIL